MASSISLAGISAPKLGLPLIALPATYEVIGPASCSGEESPQVPVQRVTTDQGRMRCT